MMNIKQLKRGFHYSENYNPWTCEDWLYQADKSNKSKAVFYGYDANLFPMPNFSVVNKEHREKVTKKALEYFKDYDGEIWFDDVKIK